MELRAVDGVRVADKTVLKVMNEMGLSVELQSEPYRFLCFKTDYLIRNAYAD